MAEERIKSTMEMSEAIIAMSDGIPGAIVIMTEMLKSNPMALLDILYFDSMEIYGEKIYKLWNDCCSRDMEKFWKTLDYLKSGKLSSKEIHDNLDLVRAKPFI